MPTLWSETQPVDLSEAMVERMIASGDEVEVVEVHEDLRRVGGTAALLRYSL